MCHSSPISSPVREIGSYEGAFSYERGTPVHEGRKRLDEASLEDPSAGPREIGNLLPNNQRQRRTYYALCHILFPVSAACSREHGWGVRPRWISMDVRCSQVTA